MTRKLADSLRRSLLGTGALLFALAACAGDRGSLVIAGGALRPDNAAVWQRFVESLPAEGNIAVITGASGAPATSAETFVQTLAAYGVEAGRIQAVRMALLDDPETPDVDESRWSDGARNPQEIATVENAAGIWFTGGDQLRLTTLLFDGGEPTPMLSAIRRRLEDGAVIGGSSAGAAIMSDPMIGRGESLAVLLDSKAAGETLVLTKGFDFLPRGVVDQHFDASARLGRLAVALGKAPPDERIGLGIDEDTAIVITHGGSMLEVLGRGSVTVLDGREASWKRVEGGYRISGLSLSVMQAGDRLNLESLSLDISSTRSPTVGREYFDAPGVDGSGMALPAGTLSELLGRELLDNAAARSLIRYSFLADGEQSPGSAFRFGQRDSSQGFWGRNADGEARYSIVGVEFSVEPVSIRIR